MFAHLVTAAKGLFTRQESPDAPADPAGTSAAITPKMASATRRETVASEKATNQLKTNGAVKQGKRKAQPATTEKTNDQQSKRRKRNSLEAAEETSDVDAEEPSQEMQQSVPKKHFRFGSEEPAVPETRPEKIPPPPQQNVEDDEDDSDDDAPETIENSAQLLKLKEQAKKQEKLRQLEEQIKKEKRRKLDERRKLQAKSKVKEISAPSDDLLSESTATIQGSTTHDARRRALPALLPDDILNAEPVARPPTPPAEERFAAPKKSNKLRFLEKTEKAPKDVQVGDVTIRVLDAPSTKQNSKPALAPKASKSGRNVRGNWLKSERSTARVNGLRMTKGGPSGFVRR
ncbi:uncharacterized protein N7459_008961 [Penicillium hispanicum]|uniref:uncharacterized protein n=1 Tax=Penicillium hispanicum TaxID=1080232 RepID=UPI00254092A4|nr:uncharacterized protein N7459_008961 [Penicillium hispanicum]KAJ5569531.1 hypothetical protein N7459_008961 [Penicillium hispanicum]